MNILITSASRKVSLLKAFERAFRILRDTESEIIAIDTNPLAVSFHFCDEAYVVPPTTDHSFIPTLLQICSRHRVKLIIPTRDEDLPIMASNKKLLAATGTRVMVPSLETVELCQDKKAFADFCLENGVLVPRIYTEAELEQGVQFPLFVRPRSGKASKNTLKLENRVELDSILNYLGGFDNTIIQEYVKDKEYTIDLFADFDGNVISVVPRERILVVGGESAIGKTVNNKILIDGAIKLSDVLGLTGHNTLQCFFDGCNVKFIEVNPRYGGAANLSINAGANTPLYLIRLMKGEKVESAVGDFQDNLVMLRYSEDIFK